MLPDIPAGAGHGDYWFTPVDPVTGEEGPASPEAIDDERSTASDTGGVPGYPSVNPQYVHWDHLGSTRLMTDEKGVTIGEWKYYPFGHEAETSGGRGNRMKFTGHERDDRLGLDYMLARYYGASLGRFASVDPGFDAQMTVPQSWNLFAYVRNNPLRSVDPTGKSGKSLLKKVKELARKIAPETVALVEQQMAGMGDGIDPSIVKGAERAIDAAEAVDAVAGAVDRNEGQQQPGGDDTKPSTLSPGSNAGEGVPASGPSATKAERDAVNQQGSTQGCHTCGSNDPGTKSGNWVPDHQPPTALNPDGGSQKLHPHCIECSRQQGGEVTQEKKRQDE